MPGGEIEAGEDHFTALQRELREELGFSADIGYYYGQADEYFYSRHRNTYFYNPAYLYEVTHFQELGAPLEDFNNLAWFHVEEAIHDVLIDIEDVDIILGEDLADHRDDADTVFTNNSYYQFHLHISPFLFYYILIYL